uniref:Uncharacterized protein n=1 Tax=Chenopodium quinoa TaxID=63459 RepID=A0A803L0T9_CHEQI
MSSTKNSSKVVRTESLLDEYHIYFSHVLSPLKRKPRGDSGCTTKAQPNQQYRVDEGDVNAKAEDYIKKRHQKATDLSETALGMLDEYNIYFSHVLVPLKKINRKAECSKRMGMMQQHDEDVLLMRKHKNISRKDIRSLRLANGYSS